MAVLFSSLRHLTGVIVTCSGNVDGASDNLATTSYDAYVDYLTNVILYYRDEMNITFSTVEPFNEPSSSWQLGNNQEGCHYDVSTQRIILQVSVHGMEYTVNSHDNGCLKPLVPIASIFKLL